MVLNPCLGREAGTGVFLQLAADTGGQRWYSTAKVALVSVDGNTNVIPPPSVIAGG